MSTHACAHAHTHTHARAHTHTHVQMMRCEITKYNKRFGVVKVDAKGYVGDEVVVEAELTLAMAK